MIDVLKLQKENSTWTAQHIQGELAKLGYDVCDNIVAKHIVGIDFFVTP